MTEHHNDSDVLDTSEDDQSHPRTRRTGMIIGAIVAGLLVLTGGAYVVGYFMAGDKTPRNASVAGIGIGGLTEDEAIATLTRELVPRYTAPITLTAADKKVTITPAEAGLTLDLPATVAEAGAGRSWSPGHIVTVLSGGQELAPVTTIDEARLKAAMAKAAPTFEVKGKNATISIQGTTVVTTPSAQAVTLNQDEAATQMKNAWPGQTSLAAPQASTDPEITTAEVEKAKADHGDKVLSGPITVKVAAKSFPIDVSTIAAATTFPVKDGTVVGQTDMEKIWKAAQSSIDDLGMDKGKNATFRFEGGRPVVVPSADGVGIEKADFTKVVEPALTRSGAERTVTVKVTVKKAEISTEDAQKMGVKEVIGQFTTEFPHAEYRNVNLSRVAQTLNGKLVAPGQTFSMNNTLGPRTTANGYVDGYVIQGSRLVKETGGGVSQSATTLFNAIFFAGLEDVEHHPHTLYFPRYPAGREATLYYGQLDLKFKNNTDYGVVIQASVAKASPGGSGSITIKIWSTRTWDKVTSTALNKSDYYNTDPQTSNAANCEPQSASPGFTVNYSRQFWKGGRVVKTEPFRWRYAATPQITCKR